LRPNPKFSVDLPQRFPSVEFIISNPVLYSETDADFGN